MNSGDSRSALRGPPKLLQLRQAAVKRADAPEAGGLYAEECYRKAGK